MKHMLLCSIVLTLVLVILDAVPANAGPGDDSLHVQRHPPLRLDSLGRPEHIHPGEDVFDLSAMFASTVPDDEYWDPQFAIPEADGDIYAMVADGDSLYVGGVFQHMGVKPYRRLVLWNGEYWQSVGDGVNGPIYTMAISGDDLFIGGEFTEAGGIAARNIVRYNRRSGQWSALGSGISGADFATVSTIYISGDTLYAGGHFTNAGGVAVRNVARYVIPANRWTPLGSADTNGVNGDVLAIGMFYGVLLVGGDFSEAGGGSANSIALWREATQEWSAVSHGQVTNGLHGYVNAIEWSPYGATIAGEFDLTYLPFPTAPDSVHAHNIVMLTINAVAVRWLGGGSSIGVIRALALAPDGTVFTGGAYLPLGKEHGSGVDGYVNAIEVSGRNVYVGGSFRHGGHTVPGRIVRYNLDDKAWSPLYAGPNGSVFALEARDTSIYAGGAFTTAQGRTAYGIAAWDGDRWDVVRPTVNGTIYAIDINGDDIYVGGYFTRAAGRNASNIARWNIPTRTWSSLGTATGVGGGISSFVAAIDSRGNDVYVGGQFTIADQYEANNVARWDGTRWWGMGDGVNGRVFAIAIAENGDVYVGGDFSAAGNVPVNNIARWDGGAWHALGAGTNKRVSRLTISGNELFVGGEFSAAGGDTARRIARWNMTQQQWLPLGGGVTAGFEPQMNGIVAVQGRVFVGGYFDQVGGVWARNIAMWDGSVWSPLGSGLDNQVRAMAANDDGLFAAGDFTVAGDKLSHHFARWMKPLSTIVAGLPQEDLPIAGEAPRIYPNPVSGRATMRFVVPRRTRCELRIYDLLGNEVASLLDRDLVAGEHQVEWMTEGVSEGTYCYRFRSGDRVASGTVVVVR